MIIKNRLLTKQTNYDILWWNADNSMFWIGENHGHTPVCQKNREFWVYSTYSPPYFRAYFWQTGDCIKLNVNRNCFLSCCGRQDCSSFLSACRRWIQLINFDSNKIYFSQRRSREASIAWWKINFTPLKLIHYIRTKLAWYLLKITRYWSESLPLRGA